MSEYIKNKFRLWRDDPLLFVRDCIQVEPSKQQIDLLTGFAKHKRTTIRSGHGCHAPGTIVLMSNGSSRYVEDVRVGEQLLGDDGTPRNVLELYHDREQMYRIEMRDGTYYDVNESHILSLKAGRTKNGYKKGELVDMSVRDYLALNKTNKATLPGYKVGVELAPMPVGIPPYILGLWLGDGWQDRPAFTSVDTPIQGIITEYAENIGCHVTLGADKKSLYIGSTGGAGDNQFINWLKEYDLLDNKHIPAWYLLNSREVRLELLAGLLDSDGWLDPRGKSVFEITQKRQGLAEDIVWLAQSVGCHATITPVEKSWTWKGIKKTGWYYRVGITRYAWNIPTVLKRKQAVESSSPRELTFPFKIKKLSVGEYYGFELDGNHRYLLGDFTVTHNTGKDASASWIIIWFMVTRLNAKVICTAPTARQLDDILWSEISKWLRQSSVADEFVIQKSKIFCKHNPKEWWARAVSVSAKSSKDEQAETLAGFHGDHMLIVCDEASGIPDPVYIPLEGAMTQEDNKCLMIGNMTKTSGYFYDTHFHSELKKNWFRLHWDSRESENVTKDMVEYFASKYGEDSSIFAVRVAGNPPHGDSDKLIPLDWAMQCVDNEVSVEDDDPLYLGVDVARYGSDDSVILPRKGFKIFPWFTYHHLNTISLGGEIQMKGVELGAVGVAIDEIGVGAGVTDWLMKHNSFSTFGINVANSSSDIKKYNRLRDELWNRVKDNCMKGRYSFPGGALGDELCNELASVGYDFNAHGGIVVDSKKFLKAKGIESPNIADALCLTEYFSNIATQVFRDKKKKRKFGNPNATRNWMVA